MSPSTLITTPFSYSTYAYNTVAASSFVIWDYCITFEDEVEFIWRRKWNSTTALFMAIRYIPLVYLNLLAANNVTIFVPQLQSSCVIWTVFCVLSMLFLAVCFEILLIMRVVALYERNRLLLYCLIALFACANTARFIIVGIMIPGYRYGQNVVSTVHTTCHITHFPSVGPSSLFITEFIPEVVLFVLAVIKLIHTKRTYKVPVSQLLVVIVRDGTWAFFLIFAVLVWNIFQFKFAVQTGNIPFIWVAPVTGFTGSRLILNLRSEARTPPGGTNVETFEIKLSPVEASSFTAESV